MRGQCWSPWKLVTVEYRIAPENRSAAFAVLARIGRERKRDGAYSWNLFQDAARPERIVEAFLVDSWVEHLHQHRRVTNADRLVEEQLRHLLHDEPRVTHYVGATASVDVAQTAGAPPGR